MTQLMSQHVQVALLPANLGLQVSPISSVVRRELHFNTLLYLLKLLYVLFERLVDVN